MLLLITNATVDHRCCRERYEGFEGAPGAPKASHYMGSEFEDCENEDEARDRAIEVAMRDFLSGREEPKSFSGMSITPRPDNGVSSKAVGTCKPGPGTTNSLKGSRTARASVGPINGSKPRRTSSGDICSNRRRSTDFSPPAPGRKGSVIVDESDRGGAVFKAQGKVLPPIGGSGRVASPKTSGRSPRVAPRVPIATSDKPEMVPSAPTGAAPRRPGSRGNSTTVHSSRYPSGPPRHSGPPNTRLSCRSENALGSIKRQPHTARSSGTWGVQRKNGGARLPSLGQTTV